MPTIQFPNPTSAQSTAFAMEVKIYQIQKDDWVKFNDALSKFKTKFLSELDCATRAMMEDAMFGTMLITILEIRQRLINAFGVLSPIDRKILFKSALAPYSGGDVRAWLNSKNLLFAELAETGEPFSVETKLRWLLDSFSGHFVSTTELWEGTYITTAMQIQHANDLSEALITAYVKSQIPTNQMNAGARHTMNVMTTLNEDEIKRRVQAGIADGLAAAMTSKGGTGICETCKGKVTERNKDNILYRWCSECFLKAKAERIAKGKARRST